MLPVAIVIIIFCIWFIVYTSQKNTEAIFKENQEKNEKTFENFKAKEIIKVGDHTFLFSNDQIGVRYEGSAYKIPPIIIEIDELKTIELVKNNMQPVPFLSSEGFGRIFRKIIRQLMVPNPTNKPPSKINKIALKLSIKKPKSPLTTYIIVVYSQKQVFLDSDVVHDELTEVIEKLRKILLEHKIPVF